MQSIHGNCINSQLTSCKLALVNAGIDYKEKIFKNEYYQG